MVSGISGVRCYSSVMSLGRAKHREKQIEITAANAPVRGEIKIGVKLAVW